MTVQNLARCSKCRAHKPFEAFVVQSSKASGRSSWCKECINSRRRERWANDPEWRAKKDAAIKEWHNNNLDRRAAVRRQRLYGISPEEQDALLAQQGERCAICDSGLQESRRRHLDHCHATGRVRGWLCPRCNTALGYLEGWAMEFESEIEGYLS